ncbi:hypothetical protein RYX36_006675 [Vicia faba]
MSLPMFAIRFSFPSIFVLLSLINSLADSLRLHKSSFVLVGAFGKGALMIFGLTIYSLLGLGVVVEFLRNDSLSITSSSDSDTDSER